MSNYEPNWKRLFTKNDQFITLALNWGLALSSNFSLHWFTSKGRRDYLNCHPYTVSVSPPTFCWGATFSPKFWKGEDQKKNDCFGGLKKFLPWIFALGAYHVSCQKTFKNKIWLYGLNFKCWSWPVLAKQPINV